ncbi:erythrocyte membrane protein 1, EMP1 [Plasmodium reichenowi]|uniref:Erythrocyte membrane protein 1, EMP1 n=1 Tax=Plasmodium reichenowi TaxID=5854 RepID=A0A060RR30_PLARE|nr:erythrocyte membrane protein 1, EMP1 [Plasmodium reichenowi]
MAPTQAEALRGGGGTQEEKDKFKYVNDSKDLLDKIGEEIQKQAKDAALPYEKDLHGHLEKATYPNDELPNKTTPSSPCKLEYQFHTNVTKTEIDPCEHKKGKRLSEVHGAECDNRKIRGSKDKEGACAPFRRLHVCDKNLEQLDPDKIESTHNLLLEVCQAAKFEGQSISGYHDQYQLTNSGSQLCTMLARSFADIGDIIRGKDLYGGDKKKDKLENKLKQYFKEIYNKLREKEAQNYYNDPQGNYYKLREDWWALNRKEVWKAITCDAPNDGVQYFRKTCSNRGTYASRKCTCISGDVPTYFDYVPQYLRWFEEWAEDFCGKRKHKLQNAIKICRGVGGREKYCDLNGYDCKQTARGKERFGESADCKKCSVPCTHFANWIDNQKQEFLKQKNKYKNEILGNSRKKRSTSNNYEGYDRKFYDELKNNYQNVSDFLEKLSKEKICDNQPHDGEKNHSIDFSNLEKTFSHTEYCQACPWCGVKCNGDTCKKEQDDSCQQQITEKKYDSTNTTDIPVLTPDKSQKNILQKYNKFCQDPNNKDKPIETWKCHYEGLNKNKCVLQDGNENTNKQKDMSYDVFFYSSFTEMLKDSIDWRTELNSCINKSKAGKCQNKCKKPCKCYERWVEEKKTEFEEIREHFGKQKDMQQDGIPPETIFKYTLKDDFLEDMENSHGDEKAIKRIKQLLAKYENEPEYESSMKTIIDYMFEDDLEEIKSCLKTHEDPCPQDTAYAGRSLLPPAGVPPHIEEEDEYHPPVQEEEEEEEEEEKVDGSDTGSSTEETTTETTTTQNYVNVCSIVDRILTDPSKFSDACGLKYGKNYGWRCIAPSNGSNTGESGEHGKGSRVARSPSEKTTTSSDTGAICIPPRRRKMYIGKIKEWATNYTGNTQVDGKTPQVEGGGTEAQTSQSTGGTSEAQTASQPNPLLEAFIQSAAVETFFLWHNYTTQWKLQHGGDGAPLGALPQISPVASLEQGPQRLSGPAGARATVGEEGLSGPVGARATVGEEGLSGPVGALGRAGELGAMGSGGPRGFQGPIPPVLPVPPGFPPGPHQPQSRGIFGNSSGHEDSSSSQPGELFDQLVGTNSGLPGSNSVENPSSPQTQLASGKIPNDFLKQMFYTLGDYRDILVHGGDKASGGDSSKDGSNSDRNIVLNAGGNKDEMQAIQKAIESTLKKMGEQSSSGNSAPPKPGTLPPSRDTPLQQRQTWWENHAEHIWHGMICALTYKENEAMGQPPQKIENPDEILKKLEEKYGTYTDVKLEDESSEIQPKRGTSPSGDIYLSKFVERPPFFRWLHEWGNSFCSERKKRLKQLDKDCRGGENGVSKTCSGYGEDCDDNLSQKYDILPSFNCPDCGNSCSSYRRWIGRKKDEYEKQENAYGEQKKKAKGNSTAINDQNFVGNLDSDYESIKLFLQKLGPCKKDNGDSNILFDDKDKTFEHAKDCGTCSEFKINCKKNNCDTTKGGDCNGKNKNHITPNDIKGSTEEIVMRVSYDSKSGNAFNDLTECNGAGIFKGFRKEKWECGKVCGYNVCKPIKYEGEKNDKEIILITAFVKRWLEYFLEDYNKIKHRISHCIKNHENKCKCVNEWINKKKDEWEKIRKRFLEQYKYERDEYYPVTSILETLITQIPVVTDKGKQKSLENLKKSLKCNCPENSRKNDGNENDVINCMLTKLDTKIKTCLSQTSNVIQLSVASPQTACETLSPSGESPPLVEDDDPLEEEENPENKVEAPGFCEIEDIPKVEVLGEDTCGDEEEEKEEEKDKGDEEEGGEERTSTSSDAAQPTPPSEGTDQSPAPAKTPEAKVPEVPKKPVPEKKVTPKGQQKKRRSREVTPSILPEMLSISAFPLSVGIAFAALSYFLLKRYIYIEGDSGTDSGYTDHYSDITSSSESEYEEFDINDIYVPHAPKYKTLIEVVLEPSKRDTQSGDIPNDNTQTNKFTDNEWNELKQNFISNMLQNIQPNDYRSADIPKNTQPNTLYFDKPEEKPFIMSIHDRNLYTGEEHSYDMSNNISNNDLYSGENDPTSGKNDLYSGENNLYSDKNDVYSGIDLINDSLNSGNQPIDIYDEILKRKENELFGTENTKHTTTNRFAKPARDDPIHNQLDLFHKWLDRHRNMCEKFSNNKEEILDNLKEKWENETHSGNKTNGNITSTSDNTPPNSDIPSGKLSDTPSDNNIHSDVPYVLNTDVSIQIHMDNPKPKNIVYINSDKSTMDNILDDLDKTYNEPYFYGIYDDDIYYDVNDDKTSVNHINMDYNKMDNNNSDVPTKVQIEMNIVNNKKEIFEEEYPMSDIWNI